MKSPLSLVDSPKKGQPLRPLGPAGRDLWGRVQRQARLVDAGSLEALQQACEALDRAQSLRDQIDRDGEMIPTRGGMRSHPCLREELACRAFIVRTLSRLGLCQESSRPIGRPPRDHNWAGPSYYDVMARDGDDDKD